MTIRDKKQKYFSEKWLASSKFSILYLCPRFGKIYTAINILEELKPKSILIAYPDKTIRESWEEDFNKRNFDDSNVTYTTHLSLKKHIDELYDIIIIDEVHLLSDAQIKACKQLFTFNSVVLGLTGTLNKYSRKELIDSLELYVLEEYSIEEGITDGIIVDYEITVVQVPLDNIVLQTFKHRRRTEKAQFNHLSIVIKAIERKQGNTMFARLGRMRVIQRSLAKLNKTKKILKQYKDERILVFCGLTDIADKLGIPSYHNKVKESSIFEDFVSGKGNHLAVVKIGNTGVTYNPLDKVIINYFDSNAENLAQKINRCMGLEYGTPDKKSHIYIICTNEPVEQKWLNKALAFFDTNKIKYL